MMQQRRRPLVDTMPRPEGFRGAVYFGNTSMIMPMPQYDYDVLPEIQREIDEVLRDTEHSAADDGGKCLYVTHAVATVLHRNGLRPIIQAGSLQWPLIPQEEDDGSSNSHFAYMWDPTHPASRAALRAGRLPEMHVWLGLLDPPTIIDFSTRDLQRHAELVGLTWRSGDPPDHLWATEDEMPDWVVYTPNQDATWLATGILHNLFNPHYLNP